MATLQTIQDSIDSKSYQYADNTIDLLSLKYKQFLLANLDPASYASKEVYKGLTIPELFERGKVYDQLKTFLFLQEQSRLTTLAISKL